MKNNRFACNHRVGARLTDGQYYTLLNKANFLGMSVNNYIIKCLALDTVPAQTEFQYYMIDGEEISEDETPDVVRQGEITLEEYHEIENSSIRGNILEDLKEDVNILYNQNYFYDYDIEVDNMDDYRDEETGRVEKCVGFFPDEVVERAYEQAYDKCIYQVAKNCKQKWVTPNILREYVYKSIIP